MQTVLVSLEVILSILGLVAVGFFVIAKNIIPKELLRLLNALAIEVALPMFIFTAFMMNFDPEENPKWWVMPLLGVVFTGFMFILSAVCCRFMGRDIRIESAEGLFINNPHFIPISIIAGVYGINSPHLVNLFLFTVFTISIYFNMYRVFFKKSRLLCGVDGPPVENEEPQEGDMRQKAGLNWKKLINPVVKATFLAVIIKLLNVDSYIPDVVIGITSHIGDMTFPLVMIILGGELYIDIKKIGKIYLRNIIKFILLKNIVFPCIILIFLYLFHPSFDIAFILLLQAASPPLSTLPVLVGRQNGKKELANQFLVSSFFFSVVSIPLILILLNRLYV
ncbi:hypothetical protein SAMN02745691_02125 [Parasporobacterium paucivorans DSM 15970]|uniref:Membrane transport protein n=2 Tax=Parasporobacterium TaxID=115543 RepID=A0A1M6K538_9FIRM|nr:hypothetical protein SAMN02745691_02125 [Parasporobacterium paucivorans DSM 15970]